MGKLDYAELVNLAQNTEGATVTLSPLSRSILLSLMTTGWDVFRWGNLTQEQKDAAENAVATVALELMTEGETAMTTKSANLYHAKGKGEAGGTPIAGSWQNRGITGVNNYGALASWDWNGFTLNAGTWLIDMSCQLVSPTAGTNAAVGLFSSTGVVLAKSNNHRLLASESDDIGCRVLLSLAAPTVIIPRYWIGAAFATYGLGRPRDLEGEWEQYMTITVWGVENG